MLYEAHAALQCEDISVSAINVLCMVALVRLLHLRCIAGSKAMLCSCGRDQEVDRSGSQLGRSKELAKHVHGLVS